MEEENEMKSFGLFNIIRGILRAIMGLVGGVMANRINVHASYAVLGVYPIIMIAYTLLIFKEEKVSFTIFSQPLTLNRKEDGSIV